MYWYYCLVLVVFLVKAEDQPPPATSVSPNEDPILPNVTQNAEKRLSDQVMQILDHYKQPDPVGIPGAPIPDPMDIPNMKHSFSVGRMEFKNVKLYGLTKFRLDHVVADLKALKVKAGLTIDILHVKGNYTLSTWISKARGPFTVNLTQVNIVAIVSLEVERSGQLEAQDIDMDIAFKTISMDFQGLGFMASVFQGVMNSVGTFVFDSIKPFVLSEANKNIRTDLNKEVKKLPMKFPNSISPFDGLICELRKKIRTIGYDPFKVPDYNNTVGILDVYLTHTWLYGASSFHRTKDIIIEVRNRTVSFLVEIGTGKLKGTSNWEIAVIAGVMSKVGTVAFSVEYIKVSINISQSMDTSKSPSMDDIQIELGNIQIRFDGLGTADYAIEFAINVLPNLLRYQIMDALEKPIRMKVQEELNQVNIERILRENADRLDNMNSLDNFQFM